MTQRDVIQTILRDSNDHLALFTKDEIDALRDGVFTKIVKGRETPLPSQILRRFAPQNDRRAWPLSPVMRLP